MKCYLPRGGCHSPDGCFDSGECYWAPVHQAYEARRKVAERECIPDDSVLVFGCALEAADHPRCEKWCHLSNCPFTLKEPEFGIGAGG